MAEWTHSSLEAMSVLSIVQFMFEIDELAFQKVNNHILLIIPYKMMNK